MPGEVPGGRRRGRTDQNKSDKTNAIRAPKSCRYRSVSSHSLTATPLDLPYVHLKSTGIAQSAGGILLARCVPIAIGSDYGRTGERLAACTRAVCVATKLFIIKSGHDPRAKVQGVNCHCWELTGTSVLHQGRNMAPTDEHSVYVWLPHGKDSVMPSAQQGGDDLVLTRGSCQLTIPHIPDEKGYRCQLKGKSDDVVNLTMDLLRSFGYTGILGDEEVEEWHYVNPEGDKFGPFSLKKLRKWTKAGSWARDFPVQNGPSGLWVPVWIPLGLDPPRKEDSITKDTDVDMVDAEAMLQQLDELRHSQQFMEVLHQVVDMEVDDLPGDFLVIPPATQFTIASYLAMTPPPALQRTRAQVLLILDTNVLLHPASVKVLDKLCQVAGPGASHPDVEVVLVVPWMVLVELDGLKSSETGIAALARGALSRLRATLEARDPAYQGQSLDEFKTAAKNFDMGLGSKSLGGDDRILQCCMHYNDVLSKNGSVKPGQMAVALLSNDNALCVKAQVNNVKSVSSKQLSVDPSKIPWALLALIAGEVAPAQGLASGHQGSAEPLTQQGDTTSTPNTPFLSAIPAGLSSDNTMNRASSGDLAARADSGTVRGDGLDSLRSSSFVRRGSDASSTGMGPPAGPVEQHMAMLVQLAAPVIEKILVDEYEDMWKDVVCVPPPWDASGLTRVLTKHWRSTFEQRLGRALEPDVEFLGEIGKKLGRRPYWPANQLVDLEVRSGRLLKALSKYAGSELRLPPLNPPGIWSASSQNSGDFSFTNNRASSSDMAPGIMEGVQGLQMNGSFSRRHQTASILGANGQGSMMGGARMAEGAAQGAPVHLQQQGSISNRADPLKHSDAPMGFVYDEAPVRSLGSFGRTPGQAPGSQPVMGTTRPDSLVQGGASWGSTGVARTAVPVSFSAPPGGGVQLSGGRFQALAPSSSSLTQLPTVNLGAQASQAVPHAALSGPVSLALGIQNRQLQVGPMASGPNIMLTPMSQAQTTTTSHEPALQQYLAQVPQTISVSQTGQLLGVHQPGNWPTASTATVLYAAANGAPHVSQQLLQQGQQAGTQLLQQGQQTGTQLLQQGQQAGTQLLQQAQQAGTQLWQQQQVAMTGSHVMVQPKLSSSQPLCPPPLQSSASDPCQGNSHDLTPQQQAVAMQQLHAMIQHKIQEREAQYQGIMQKEPNGGQEAQAGAESSGGKLGEGPPVALPWLKSATQVATFPVPISLERLLMCLAGILTDVVKAVLEAQGAAQQQGANGGEEEVRNVARQLVEVLGYSQKALRALLSGVQGEVGDPEDLKNRSTLMQQLGLLLVKVCSTCSMEFDKKRAKHEAISEEFTQGGLMVLQHNPALLDNLATHFRDISTFLTQSCKLE